LRLAAKAVDPLYGTVSSGSYSWTLEMAGSGQRIQLGSGAYNPMTRSWEASLGFLRPGPGLDPGQYLVRHRVISSRDRSGYASIPLVVGSASAIVSGVVRAYGSEVPIAGAQVAIFKASGPAGFWTVLNNNYGGMMPPLSTLLTSLVPVRPTLVTAHDGAYLWLDVPVGDSYVIVASATDYQPQRTGSFTVSGNGTTISRNFSLKPAGNTLASLEGQVKAIRNKAQGILDYNAEVVGRLSERYYEDDLYNFNIDWFSKVASLVGAVGGGFASLPSGVVASSSDGILHILGKVGVSTAEGLLLDQNELLRATIQNGLFPANALAFKEWAIHEDYQNLLDQKYHGFTQNGPSVALAPAFSYSQADGLREQLEEQMDEIVSGHGLYVASPVSQEPIRGFTLRDMANVYHKESDWLEVGDKAQTVLSGVQLAAGSVLIYSGVVAATGVGTAPAATVAGGAVAVNTAAGVGKKLVTTGKTLLKSAMAAQYVNTVIGTYPNDNESAYLSFQDFVDFVDEEAVAPFYLREGNRFSASVSIKFPNSFPRDDVMWSMSDLPLMDVAEKIATVTVEDQSSLASSTSPLKLRCLGYSARPRLSLKTFLSGNMDFILTGSSVVGAAMASPGGTVKFEMPYRGQSKQSFPLLKPHVFTVDSYIGPWRTGSAYKPFYVLSLGELFNPLLLLGSPIPLTGRPAVLAPISDSEEQIPAGDMIAMTPPVVPIFEDLMSTAVPSLTASFTVGTNLWAVDLLLFGPPEEGISLLVTDSQGRRMGYASQTGLTLNEIPGVVTDMRQRPIVIRLFQPPDNETYTVTTALLTPGAEPVQVSLFYEEEPVSGALMAAQPSRVLFDSSTESAPEIRIALTEESGQISLTNVVVTLSDLMEWDGTNVIALLTNNTLALADIGAGGSGVAVWPLALTNITPKGKYTSIATLNSAQTANLTVPVVVLLRDATEMVSTFAGTNYGEGEIQLQHTFPSAGYTQTWVHIPKGFFVLHGTLGLAPGSTNLQSPTVDIGADSLPEFAFSGLMDVGLAVPDLETAFNAFLKTNPVPATGALVPLRITGNEGQTLIMGGLQLYLEKIPNQLRAPVLHPDGTVQLVLVGQPGFTYRIETSPDLTTWSFLRTITATNTSTIVMDASVSGTQQRFYRAALE